MNNFLLINSQIENFKKTETYFNFGKTRCNRNLTCFVLGNKKSNKSILIQCGIHAREFITSYLATELINYLKNFKLDFAIYVVVISNPDGLDICENKTKNINNIILKQKIKQVLKNKSNKLYKANANLVDINTNFNAVWGGGKLNECLPNIENFIGYLPNSENETKALISLVDLINPILTLSYHSKGNVIYYGFKNQSREQKLIESYLIKIMRKLTKYKPIKTKNSTGGFKDYCIYNKNILGFTIEVGNDNLAHPIKKKYLPSIFNENKLLILKLIKGLERIQ